MQVKGYVVHLERAAGRRPQALELTHTLPVPTVILPAVDGRALDDATKRRYVRRRLHAPRYPFQLLDAEIGCFLSYRRAWQAILDDGCDAGLIVEDDVAPCSPRFDEVLATAMATIRPGEYIRFPLLDRTDRGPEARDVDGAQLLEPRLPGLGMQMQLVERDAARRLLDATTVFDRPVDCVVQMQWLHGARVLAALPVIVREIDFQLGGSVIQMKRAGLVHKAMHEIQRPIARLAVRAINERWRRRHAA
ncbi:MAG: glycosyltransferase family 25 protein [Planctomycetaceae bacterium]